jgi:hypothetical protein
MSDEQIEKELEFMREVAWRLLIEFAKAERLSKVEHMTGILTYVEFALD